VGLENLARDLGDEPHRVRLLVGPGPEVQVTASVLSASPAPARVALTPNGRRGPRQPLHLPQDHAAAGLYESARQETQALIPEAEDVLLVNERGEVTESTIANLVVDLDGVLVTPPLSSGLLAGVYRQYLLDSGIIRERVLQPHHVRNARADVSG
jgi:para-aminobenzoate synthetase / 4-amino-4-deoxychorismate lyase